MKVLRVIGNIILGIILFASIFALTFTRTTKNFLEKDVILGVVKEKITETVKEESGKLTDKGEALIDDMFKDNASSDVIRLVIDNFEKYQEEKTHFKISDADIEKIVSYATKYKSTIVEISGNKIKDLSDEELKKILSSENINNLANEIFESFDKDLGDGIDIAVKTYIDITSDTALLILVSSIIACILLLLLINWSLYKWMLTGGIAIITSGVFISLIFLAGLLFNDVINSIDIVKEAIGEISLNNYIIWGSIEIVVGIILIIIYNVIKNKNDEEFKKLDNL